MLSLPPALAGLAAFPQFLLYKTVPNVRTGKNDKFPCNYLGEVIDAHDRQYWMSAEYAFGWAQRCGLGVAFVLSENDPFFFIDIDSALQPDRTWSSIAQQLCTTFAGCAIEVSQSGTGLHILGRGAFGEHRKKNKEYHIELYTEARFVALTGTNIVGNVDHVVSSEVAQWLVATYFQPRAAEADASWTTEPVPEWRGPTTDEELLRRALKSKSAANAFGHRASFADLWTADEDTLAKAYPSASGDTYDRSSADAALASHLHFWTGRNCERVRQLMERSGLKRDKWTDRPEYLETTVLAQYAQARDVCQDKPISGLTANGLSVVLDANGGRQISTLEPLPHTTVAGKPKPVVENYAEVFRRAGVIARYDVIAKRVDILIPGQAYHTDKGDVAKLAWLSSLCAHFGLPRDGLGDYVTLIASQNLHNPALTWIDSKPWDGVSRLPQFFETITPSNDSTLPDGRRLRDILMLRWMLSAVAAVASPDGFASQGILVLSGAQGLGKSRWVESLVPDELGLIRLGAILKPDDRDSITAAVRTWITELGELDGTLRKSDVAQLKAFITNPVDIVRLPYERAESRFTRRTVFVATCNKSSFLVDETGNRKFWVIAVSAVNADHNFDVQQVWAEALHLWRAGQPAYLMPDERAALDNSNDNYTIIDPIEDRISARLNWNADRSLWAWKTTTDVLALVGVDRPTRSDVTRAGVVLERFGAINKKSNGVRYRLVPPAVSLFTAPVTPGATTGATR